MNKMKLNYLVEIIMLISLVTTVAATFVQPLREFHPWAGRIFVLAAITHFAMHVKMFSMIQKNVFRKNQ